MSLDIQTTSSSLSSSSYSAFSLFGVGTSRFQFPRSSVLCFFTPFSMYFLITSLLVIQRQHFCHHVETICRPKSSYVPTKLYGTSTFGCNNRAYCDLFRQSHVHVSYRRRMPATLNWRRQSSGCQSNEMEALVNSSSSSIIIYTPNNHL